jgi:hypothetical protein
MCYWLNIRKNDYIWVRHITKNGIFILTHNTVWWKTLSTISWPLSGKLQVNRFLSNTHIFGSTFKLWVYLSSLEMSSSFSPDLFWNQLCFCGLLF